MKNDNIDDIPELEDFSEELKIYRGRGTNDRNRD
jgi:hypothetical protein